MMIERAREDESVLEYLLQMVRDVCEVGMCK